MTLSSSSLTKSHTDILTILFFWLFVITVLVIHIVTFFKLNIVTIDSDQPYMWLGAKDFSQGHFYEPRYYAQEYNTFMEALFAVPFIWMKLPVYYAVPIATHIIFLFPFLFLSFYLFFHQKKIQAILVLAVIICLPAEYDLLTSLPRGFVTGLFFTSFFVVSILNPTDLRFFVLNTVFIVLGYFVNPNSVLVSAPFLIYIFLINYKSRGYYVATFFSVCTFFPLHLFFNGFYKTHPDYIMNDIHYRFSTAFFWESISDLDKRFAHVSFFIANNCTALLVVLSGLAISLYSYNKKAFVCFWIFIAVVLLSFCSGKTAEGSTWAYMSLSRMYLGIPLFICLFLALIEFKSKKIYFVLFCFPLVFSAFKLINQERLLAWHYNDKYFHGVKVFTLKNSLEAIDFYKKECRKRNLNFILMSNRFWMNNIICYGGPAIDDDYPETQETKLEKRYWVRKKNNQKIFKSFILISSKADMKSLLPPTHLFTMEKIDDFGLTLVKENSLKTADFIRFINTYEPYD